MERIIAKLEQRLTAYKDLTFSQPNFDPVQHARRIGQVEELRQLIDLLREESRNDEDR